METLGSPAWFGQYRLSSRIATGGMAEVYVGRHITPDGQFGPMVAVKRLLPHLVKDQAIVRMFLNEARITAQINHPNVVRIVDLGNQAGEPYIAMELLDGHTFADLREKVAEEGKRVPVGVTLRVLTDACRGLDAAHRAVDEQGQPLRLVHRDFTPDNIHVGFSGEVKVIDFGVAKTAMWGAGTEPGTLKGKFFYMSPEMILAKPVDHRADVFATGVMLYEQLCGRRPFTGNSVDEVVMRIAQGNPRPPRAMDPSVPPALDEVCLRALEHDPSKRFQSLQQFIDALEAIGGVAELASPDELGAYVRQVFPAEKDPRQQTLRRAREVDPSTPYMPTPAQGSAQAEAVLREGHPAEVAADEVAADQPAQPSTQAPLGPAAPSTSRLPMIAGALALVVALAGAGYWFTHRAPTLTPDEAIARARTVQGTEREDLLKPLFKAPLSPPQFDQVGTLLIEARDWPDALALAELWKVKAPTDARAFLLEGRASLMLRKGKKADAAFEKASALSPGDALADVAQAEMRELQGDAAGALEAWSRAARKSPRDWKARARQGYWLSQAGRLDEATPVLTAVLKEQFDGTSAAELGFVKFRKEDVRGALTLLREVVKRDPGQMAAHYYLGAVLYAQGEPKAARAEYLEADRLAPTDSRSMSALCEMQAQTKDAELEQTRMALAQRFPEQAQALLARCVPTPPTPAAP